MIDFQYVEKYIFAAVKILKHIDMDIGQTEGTNLDIFKKGEIVLYEPDSSIRLEVRMENETVWLNLNQMALLFGRDKSVISRHIKNIFYEGELQQTSTVANFATVQVENKREVIRNIEYFNLDVIISVGYRVKSIQGTRFRSVPR